MGDEERWFFSFLSMKGRCGLSTGSRQDVVNGGDKESAHIHSPKHIRLFKV